MLMSREAMIHCFLHAAALASNRRSTAAPFLRALLHRRLRCPWSLEVPGATSWHAPVRPLPS
eukprot:649108-Pyramimonas_sp.AAC.2